MEGNAGRSPLFNVYPVGKRCFHVGGNLQQDNPSYYGRGGKVLEGEEEEEEAEVPLL